MTGYMTPYDQRWETDYKLLKQRVQVLEQQVANGAGAYAAFACTSTTRPSSPHVGQEIYETDTTRMLVWTGSAWQQVTYTPLVCTSTTRPTATFTGFQIFETDTGNERVWSGTAWEAVVHTGAWTSYTPSFNGTKGNGSIFGRWSRSGRTVTAVINLNWGTTTGGASVFQFGLPVAASSALGGVGYVGSAYAQSFASFNRAGIFIVNPGGIVGVPVNDNDNGWTATDPQTWGNGDQLAFTVTYEAAS